MNNFKLHNEFTFVCEDTKTGHKEEYKAYNVVTNQGISRVASTNSITGYLFLGKGDGTPSATDTSLFTHVLSRQTTLSSESFSDDGRTLTARYFIKLDETEQNGVTFTEVGFAYSTASSALCTHAMIVDSQGQPMGITKTDTMIMYVYATIYVTYDATGATWYGKDSLGISLLTPGMGSAKRTNYIGFYSKGPFTTGQENSSDYTVPVSKTATTSQSGNTYKYSTSLLGAEGNSRMLKYFGLIGAGSKPHPALLYNLKDYVDFPEVTINVATGDGVTTKFFIPTRYFLVNNEKLKFKVGDNVVVPKAKFMSRTSDIMEGHNVCYNGISVTYSRTTGKYYRLVDNNGSPEVYTMKYSIYECTNYNDPGKLIAVLPNIKSSAAYVINRAAILKPTHVPNKFFLHVYGTSIAGTDGIYTVTVGDTPKDATMQYNSAISTLYCNYTDDYRFFNASDNTYFVGNDLSITKVDSSSHSTILGNLLVSTLSRKVKRLEVTPEGTYNIVDLGYVVNEDSPSCSLLFRTGQKDLYAFFTLRTMSVSAADREQATVTLINSATGAITSEKYSFINVAYLSYTTWSSNNIREILPGNYESYSMNIDIDNKVLYALPISNYGTTMGPYIGCLDYNETLNEWIGTFGTVSYRLLPSEEYVYGFEFDTPPAPNEPIYAIGQRDGIYKSTDYKIDVEISSTVNA